MMGADNFFGSIEILYKLIGPALLVLFLMYGLLGYYVLDMYKFNVIHKINGAFPSQSVIIFYFMFTIFAVFFMAVIIAFQTSLFNKNQQITKDNSKLPSGTPL